MDKHTWSLSSVAFAAALVVLAAPGLSHAAPRPASPSPVAAQAPREQPARTVIAQSGDSQMRGTHLHGESRGHNSFNDEYVFGLTRGVADSSMHPAVKILVFPITVPLDIALLPFEVIGGFF